MLQIWEVLNIFVFFIIGKMLEVSRLKNNKVKLFIFFYCCLNSGFILFLLNIIVIITKKSEKSLFGLVAHNFFLIPCNGFLHLDLFGLMSTRIYLISTFLFYHFDKLRGISSDLKVIHPLKPTVMTNMKIGSCLFSLRHIHKLLILIFLFEHNLNDSFKNILSV